MPSDRKKSVFFKDEINDFMQQVKIPKDSINYMVIDYLIKEGYESTVQQFAKESGITPHITLDQINERMLIRKNIQSGKIHRAISLIDELYPQFLEESPSIHFSLLRLQLIELIKSAGNSEDGLMEIFNFASDHLASRIPKNDETLLNELEKTMSLLLFSDSIINNSNSMATNNNTKDNSEYALSIREVSDLINPNLRWEVAADVNNALLEMLDISPKSKMNDFIQLGLYTSSEYDKSVSIQEASR